MARARAGGHKVDGKGATLAVGVVGWGKVQGLAVVEERAAGGQIDDGGLGLVDLVADIEQSTGLFGAVVAQGGQMRAGHQVHGAVFDIYIV